MEGKCTNRLMNRITRDKIDTAGIELTINTRRNWVTGSKTHTDSPEP